MFSENGEPTSCRPIGMPFAKPQGMRQRRQPGQIARRNQSREAGRGGRGTVARATIQRLRDFRRRIEARGSDQHVHGGKQVVESFLNQRADAHGLQIFLGGNLQPGFEPGDLVLVGELIHFAALDERLEDRGAFRGDDGADDGAIGKLGQFGFDDLDAQRADGFESLGVVGARRGINPFVEVGRRETDA